jgi:hypothetical protein
MHPYHQTYEPPRASSVAERLRQLNDKLQALGSRLKTSIASLIGSAIADAVRDAVRALLGEADSPPERPRYQPSNHWEDTPDRYWDEDRSWPEEEDFSAHWRSPEEPAGERSSPNRWRNALTMGLQAALWWLKHEPRRRPVLTTVAVTLAAGATAYVAGPTLAAGAGILASVASLLLTADAVHSAIQLTTG